MKREIQILLVMLLACLKTFSQTNPLDPITDTSANYSGNLSYNTGEVYVIYEILNQPIVSKDANDLVDELKTFNLTESPNVNIIESTQIITLNKVNSVL